MNKFNKIKSILGKNNLIILNLIIIATSFQIILEILSIGLILPILSVIVNPELITNQKYIQMFYEFINASSANDFLKKLLIIFFILYSSKVLLSILFKYAHAKYQFYLVKYTTTIIIKKYLSLDYNFFLKNKNSKLITNLYNECKAFVEWFISPLIVLLSEFIFLCGLITLLLFVDFRSTFVVITLFSLFGSLFLFFTRKKIGAWGKDRQIIIESLLHKLNQIFDGIKIIKIFQKEEFFIKFFKKDQSKILSLLLKNDMVAFLPRILLEYVVVISLIIILLLNMNKSQALFDIIPIIGLYTVATLKLIPTATKIMVSFQNLKFGSPSVDRIYEETLIKKNGNITFEEENYIKDFNEIKFIDIKFRYNQGEKNVLDNLNFKFSKGEFIGIMGESGSGKTTFLNILLGLLKPSEGGIQIDEKDFTNEYKKLRGIFSLVSQENFLFDDTIVHNITLEEDELKIDNSAFDKATNVSQLDEMIDSLKEKEKSFVGQNGLLVSGGQKQRISIARAIYRKSKILVLDEATSNLDESTENRFIDSLLKNKDEKTIIFVTHRKSTLKLCDKIYTMQNNKLKLV